MTESLPPASSSLESESADKLQEGLVADYLCATNPKDEEKALAALRKDEFRLEMAGMTPEQRALWSTLDKVDWKAVQREGLTSVLPLLFGAYLGLTLKPEEATTVATALGVAGTGLEMASMAAVVPETIARHQRASGLAKMIAAVRVGTFYAGKVGLWTALGTGIAALAHRSLLEAQAAAQVGQPEVGRAGGGREGITDNWGADIGSGADRGGQGPGEPVGPPRLTPEQTEFVNRAGEVADQEIKEMADAAKGAAEIAARQAAELQAATSVGLTGRELAGGTIWGNELEFARQQGVYHVEPATNLLKEFAKLIAQPQPPTEIGPSDSAYLVNRDVAGWAVKQLDTLYRMDPSTMNPWQKALWEIGRGLRPAGWQDLQGVTEEYVRSTINH